jgi:hypothetical protein
VSSWSIGEMPTQSKTGALMIANSTTLDQVYMRFCQIYPSLAVCCN